MIEKIVGAHLGNGDKAMLNDRGEFALTLKGRTVMMTEVEARRLWSNLGTMFRESAKWRG